MLLSDPTCAALDWLAVTLEERHQQLAQRIADIDFADAPKRPLEVYVGTYAEELLGTAEVAVEDGELIVRSGMVEGVLRPVEAEGDVFFTQMFDSDDQVTFLFDEGETPTGLRIRGAEETFVRRE